MGWVSELLVRALGSESVHELWQAHPAVKLVFIKSAQKALKLYLNSPLVLSRLLPQQSCLIQVALEVPPELAARQESSLKPVKLIKDGSQGHGHALFNLLADRLNHALSIDGLAD